MPQPQKTQMYWVIRSEVRREILGVHPASAYRDYDEAYDAYRSVADHFTIEEVERRKLTKAMKRVLKG